MREVICQSSSRLNPRIVGDQKMTSNEQQIDRIMNATGWSSEEFTQKFSEFIAEMYPELWEAAGKTTAGLDEEDFDTFMAAFEVTTIRRGGGGNAGKGPDWVGMIVGYLGTRDLMEKQRTAVIDASGDISSLLRYGISSNNKSVNVGRVAWRDTSWTVYDHGDKPLYRQQGVETEPPEWAIPGKTGVLFALMGANGPKKAYSFKREWLVVVNEKDKFLSEGPLPPMTLECSWDAAEVDIRMNVPVMFKAEKDAAWYDSQVPVLKAGNISPQYGLDWVDDGILTKVQEMFSPEQFLPQFVPYEPDLSKLHEYHDENLRITDQGREVGPTFLIRGVVDYLDHDGKEREYSEGGYQHSLTLMSNSLRNMDSNASIWVDVSRKLVTMGAFNVVKNNETHTYAKGSQVFAVVQTRSWVDTMGETRLSFAAKNVWASALRSIIAEDVPEDAGDMGDFGGFRG